MKIFKELVAFFIYYWDGFPLSLVSWTKGFIILNQIGVKIVRGMQTAYPHGKLGLPEYELKAW